jgi:hypothetical protein
MARIVFAWEHGGELGHAMASAALARVLNSRGHRIAFIFRELQPLSFIPGASAYDVFQAPVFLDEGRGAPMPVSYADILLACGYDDARHVTDLLGRWLALLEDWKPDLLLADMSPTALLAARLLRLKRIAHGNGFAIPPRRSPLPAFRFDATVAPERVAAADSRALAGANAALAHFGGVPMRHLAEQFETDADFLTTFPELDSYGNRPQAGYWGPQFSADSGASVHWPAGNGKRVLVYVKKRNEPQVDGLIAAFTSAPHRVAAFIPGLDPRRVDALRSPRRIVSERPMRFAPLLKECDLFVSTGGSACPGTLMSGVPQLVFPSHYEQYLTARRVEQLGVGLWMRPQATPGEIASSLNRILDEPAFMASARAYARRYPEYSPAEQQRRMVMRIEEIIAAPSRWGALPPPDAPPILSPTSPAPGASR